MKKLLFLVMATAILSGCVTTSFKAGKTLTWADKQKMIALMPADVTLGELSAGGVFLPHAEWTKKADGLLGEALRAKLAGVQVDMIEGTVGSSPAEKDVQLVKLHQAVGFSILLHQYQTPLALPTKKESFDWTLGEDVRLLKERYGADYALFVYMKDSYATAGRAAAMVLVAVLGGALQGGTQVGFASLVDLNTGEVVWFNRLARGAGDLRTEQGAKETVEALLADFPV